MKSRCTATAAVVTRSSAKCYLARVPVARGAHRMSNGTAKQLAIRALEELPEDATLEDAMERLYFLEKIERGRADVRAGDVVAHEDVITRFGLA